MAMGSRRSPDVGWRAGGLPCCEPHMVTLDVGATDDNDVGRQLLARPNRRPLAALGLPGLNAMPCHVPSRRRWQFLVGAMARSAASGGAIMCTEYIDGCALRMPVSSCRPRTRCSLRVWCRLGRFTAAARRLVMYGVRTCQ